MTFPVEKKVARCVAFEKADPTESENMSVQS